MSTVVRGLKLRPIEVNDAWQIAKWFEDPEARGASEAMQKQNLRDADFWRGLASARSGKTVFVILDPNGTLVGVAPLFNITKGSVYAGLAVLDKTVRGRGYAFTAKLLQLKFAFETLKVERVLETIPTNEEGLLSYMESIGYRRVGGNVRVTEIEYRRADWANGLRTKLVA
jgi:RimJ/RimL family protein N-acetyltransferase